MSEILMINNNNKFDEVMESANDKLIVIDFYATWCGPCKQISPKLKAMVTEFPEVVFAKIDVDDEDVADIIAKYNISSMPTFLFIKNKKKIDVFSGANENMLREFIAKYK